MKDAVTKKKQTKTRDLADRWDVVWKVEKALQEIQDPLEVSIEYVRAENREGELAIYAKLTYRKKIPPYPFEGGMC